MRRFARSRKGNIAIISALMMPAIVGFCGLATETGYWYYRHRDIQAAADIAAYGGAVLLRSGGTSTAITSAATADAVTNGWRQASGTIAVYTPPTSGAYQNNKSVQVVLTENQTRYFTRFFFGNSTVPISVRSTSTIAAAGPACILGLNTSASGTVEFWGNSTANFTACNVATNSANASGFKQGASSSVWVPCAYTAGDSQSNAGLHLTSCPSVNENYPPTPDPYKNVPAPPISGCTAAPNSTPSNTVNMTPGCYNGVDFKGTVNLAPGTYVINGGSFKANSGTLVYGTGVTIYLTNGATLAINGGAHLELSAPTSGTYSGLTFFGDRTQPTADNTLNGNASTVITGAVYFPSQTVRFLGNFSGANGCMQVIADIIYYTGNGTFSNNCSGYGMQTVEVPGAVSMVE